MKPKVSVILPTYNEKENVLNLIKEIHKELYEFDHEILVVDDDSPDGTYEAVVKLDHSFVTGILRKENKGFALSIRCGIENAKGDFVIIMDSDFNHQPKYLPFMIQALDHYECVSGSRFVYGGGMNSKVRNTLSWIFNIFVRIVTGKLITDSLYGYLAIKKEILEKCDYDDIFWGYGDYCIRLMFYLQRRKVNILQFPAVNGYRKNGEGNNRFLKVFWQYFIETLKLVYKERIRKNDKRNF